MTKTIISFLFFLIIIASLSALAYFYYIKPQREYIKISTQSCISKAMAPINNEVGKGPYSAHYSDEWFNAPLKKQKIDLAKCVDAYNSILFSLPEKKLLELSLNSMVDAQTSKIATYKQEYANIISENQKNQNEIDRCNQLKTKYEQYQSCVNAASKNGQFSNDCEYPQDVFNNLFRCAMIGVSI